MPGDSAYHHALRGLGATMGIVGLPAQHLQASPGHTPGEEIGGCELLKAGPGSVCSQLDPQNPELLAAQNITTEK